jgi:hypothetical protein
MTYQDRTDEKERLKRLRMNRAKIGLAASITLLVTVLVFFITAVWVGDDRFAGTGFILFFPAVVGIVISGLYVADN